MRVCHFRNKMACIFPANRYEGFNTFTEAVIGGVKTLTSVSNPTGGVVSTANFLPASIF